VRKIILSIAVVVLLVLMFVGTSDTSQPDAELVSVSEVRSLLGTAVTITVYAEDEISGKAHLDAAFDRIAEIENLISSWKENSELRLALKQPINSKIPISKDMFQSLHAGIAWHKKSGGAFDITIGPLIQLWKSCGKSGRLPTDAEITEAKNRLGVEHIVLDETHSTLKITKENLGINLGGVGKGYCAQEVGATLNERGVKHALIAIAGDIYALGGKPNGAAWSVGVQDPREPNSPQALLSVLHLNDMAVSTSGNYQRYVEIQGKRYSHIIDPRTGLTAEEAPSVTVVGPNVISTDVLGTALSVMGVKEGLAFVENMPEFEALFITFDDDNKPIFTRSSGFSKFEVAGGGKTDYRK